VWKGYRGGATSRIWVADLPDCRIEKIPRENSNDFDPMWVDGRIYFLSDRDGLTSLFAYDVAARTVSKVIDNPESDILSASAGPGAIVYERFGSLHLHDFETGRSRRLDIRVSGEMSEKKPRSVGAADILTGMRLSPTGDRVLIEARGELLVMRAGRGEAKNVTNSPGVFERFPAWSPDGKRIACFSDESGEYALHVRNVDGTGSVKRIDLGTPPNFFFTPTAPDSRKIARRITAWPLVRRRRERYPGSYRQRLLPGAAVEQDRGASAFVVSRQQVAELHENAQESPAGALHLFPRNGPEPPGHRRHERRLFPAVRPERQVPLLRGGYEHRSCAR
jgi:tricorn protease